MIVNRILNEADGIEAVVSQIGATRFSVALRDVDADEYVASLKFYRTLDAANAAARNIVGGVK